MEDRFAVCAGRIFAFALVALFLLTTTSVAQPNVQGQWTTLPYAMPINPVHVALLHTGKVLVVSGSGNVAGNTNYQAAIWDPQAKDRKSTRLNSSHVKISYAVFCLKKKN